ncbi:Ada metal-binding domain-containing protein, partial [Streptomyces althioticus]
TAAAAQGAGFRACRRCRPDAVPHDLGRERRHGPRDGRQRTVGPASGRGARRGPQCRRDPGG